MFLALVHGDSPLIQWIHINGAQKCALQLENPHLAENLISALCQQWVCYCQTISILYWRYCSSWQQLVQEVVTRVLRFSMSVFKYIILWRLNYYCPWAKIYVWLACANTTLLITIPQLEGRSRGYWNAQIQNESIGLESTNTAWYCRY